MINWKDQKRLAEAMGVHPNTVNDILCRRVGCPPKRADDMSDAYLKLFDVYVPSHEFIQNDRSIYPVFKEALYESKPTKSA